jgi:polysaccharide pyruvyl transferase WcaK-like protein
MRLLVDNSAYHLENAGDRAMLQAGLARFKRLWPEAEADVIVSAPQRLGQVCPWARAVPPVGKYEFLRPGGVLIGARRLLKSDSDGTLDRAEQRLRARYPQHVATLVSSYKRLRHKPAGDEIMVFVRALHAADAVVATGGGFVTDSFEEHGMFVLRLLALAQSMGKPTAMFGQGLGPITSPALGELAARVLSRLDLLALREGRSGLPLLRELGVPLDHVTVTGDDAISLACTRPVQALGSQIGLNIRNADYAQVGTDKMEDACRAVEQLAAALSTTVAVVEISETEDRPESVRRMAGQGEPGDGPTSSELSQVLDRIAACRVVVTCSYHAAIFALTMGIPVVALYSSAYYEHKLHGVADQFGLGCDVLDMNTPMLVPELVGAVQHMWDLDAASRQTLRNRALEQVELSDGAYERFAGICAKEGVHT